MAIKTFCECESAVCGHNASGTSSACTTTTNLKEFHVATIRQTLCERCAESARTFCKTTGWPFVALVDDTNPQAEPTNEELLEQIREAQTNLWKLVGQLETRLKVDIDSTQDFHDATLESLEFGDDATTDDVEKGSC